MITKNVMVTIAGRPNVGKSTLTNALVGEKISIVSNKPQTTRNRIFAILNQDDTQIILTDTPGFHRAKNRLGDYMVKCVEESVADVDVIALVVEPIANVGVQEEQLIAKIKATRAWTRAQLENLGFTVLPSDANFLFAKTDKMDGGELYRKLKDRGVLVRHFTNSRICQFNRITVGTDEEMARFVEIVKELLAQ